MGSFGTTGNGGKSTASGTEKKSKVEVLGVDNKTSNSKLSSGLRPAGPNSKKL